MYKMALLVKKLEREESCKFLTEDIMAAKNLHFAPKFSQNEDFSAHNIAFWMQIFSPKKSYES